MSRPEAGRVGAVKRIVSVVLFVAAVTNTGRAAAADRPAYCKQAKTVRSALVALGKAENPYLLQLTDLPEKGAKKIDGKLGEAMDALAKLQAAAPLAWQAHVNQELAYQRAVKKIIKTPNSLHNLLLEAEKVAAPPNADDAFNKLITKSCGFYLDR